LIGELTSAYAQSANNNKTNKQETANSFFDRFKWVTDQRHDLNEFNFVGGYSFHSTRGFWGKIPDAKLRIFILRYNRKLFVFNKRHLIEYVGEINVSANYNIPSTSRYQADSFTGYGLSPLGFQFNFNKTKTVQPFFKTSTGFMYFDDPFPDRRGVKFNFTLEIGAGLEFVITPNISLSIGYKYHHMSNFQFGQINPGIDSNIFYTGITIF
jgi:hypothetical protein